MLPRDFFNLGIELLGRGTQADARTGISRLYYAIHLEAMRLARDQGFEASGRADDHGALIRHFRARGGYSWLLPVVILRSARNHADYHVEDPDDACKHCDIGLDFPPATLTSLQADAEALFERLAKVNRR